MKPIFHFYNEFDAITVAVTAANGETTHDATAPFTVTLTHDDPAIGTKENDVTEVCPTLARAMLAFNRLVANELEAIAGEIDR